MMINRGGYCDHLGKLLAAWLLSACLATAQETVWTTTVSSVSFTNAANWSAGVPGTVAGVNDTAVFTNNRVQTVNITSVPQCANATFRSTTGTVTLAIGTASSYAWSVTNSLVLSPAAITTNTVIQTGNGILSVMNAAGTAQVTIGQNGAGAYTGKLNANTVTVGANSGSVGTLTLTAGSLGAVTLAASAGSQGTLTINPGSVSNASLTLGGAAGSSSALNWGGAMTVGGVSDPNTLVNGFLGTSFGKDRSQTLAVTTNYVNTTLPNGLILGESLGGTGVLAWAGGTLVITNSSGTSVLTIGGNGIGSFSLNAGTAMVDRIIATNNTLTATNSVLAIGGGTLTTRGNSEVLMPSGGVFRITGTWNAAGGSTFVHSPGATGDFQIAANSALVVSGPSTVFTSALWSSSCNLFQGSGAQLVVSNGAQLVFGQRPGSLSPTVKGSDNVRVLVTDPNSRLDATNFTHPQNGWRLAAR